MKQSTRPTMQIPMRKTKDGRVYQPKIGRPPKPANEKKIKHPTCYDPDVYLRLTRIAHENRVSIGQVVNSLLRKAFEAAP